MVREKCVKNVWIYCIIRNNALFVHAFVMPVFTTPFNPQNGKHVGSFHASFHAQNRRRHHPHQHSICDHASICIAEHLRSCGDDNNDDDNNDNHYYLYIANMYIPEGGYLICICSECSYIYRYRYAYIHTNMYTYVCPRRQPTGSEFFDKRYRSSSTSYKVGPYSLYPMKYSFSIPEGYCSEYVYPRRQIFSICM